MKPSIVFNRLSKCWKQRKCGDVFTESREFGHSGDVAKKLTVKLWGKGVYAKLDQGSANTHYFIRHTGQFIYSKLDFLNSAFGVVNEALDGYESTADMPAFDCHGVNPYFMYYRAIQPSFYITNGMIADGSRKAKRVHAETFLQMPLMLPSIEEQDKIAWFFRKLEDTITIHQRKINSMKRLKKSLLQKMFPQNGECVPEIRFSGFTDSWEQRKFSEVFDSIPNNTLSRSELSTDEGTVKNVHYGDVLINFDEYIDVQKTVLPCIVNEEQAKKATRAALKNGDVVIADTAEDETVGKCTEVGNIIDDVVVSGLHTIPSRPKFKFGKGYLGFYMNSSAYHDQLRPLIQGIKVSSISKSALSNTLLKYPQNTAEQEKIGSFFLMIDDTITLHQRKALQLQKIKQALLQHMFI